MSTRQKQAGDSPSDIETSLAVLERLGITVTWTDKLIESSSDEICGGAMLRHPDDNVIGWEIRLWSGQTRAQLTRTLDQAVRIIAQPKRWGWRWNHHAGEPDAWGVVWPLRDDELTAAQLMEAYRD